MNKKTKQTKETTPTPIEKGKQYSLQEAVRLVKEHARAQFDETVELHINLSIDPKQSNQQVRGTIVLPHGSGRSRRVAVIAKGEKLKEAEQSGADITGSEELIDKISRGWLEFDVLVATPDSMRDLSKLGKILGPKGLMPNPKSGTVTFDLLTTVKEIKAGRVEFKNDSYGIIHCPVGKVSFSEDHLTTNIRTLLTTILKAKPASTKGQYLRSITLASTMGPGISIDPFQKF